MTDCGSGDVVSSAQWDMDTGLQWEYVAEWGITPLVECDIMDTNRGFDGGADVSDVADVTLCSI